MSAGSKEGAANADTVRMEERAGRSLASIRRTLSAAKYALNRRCAALLRRALDWLDGNAERQGGGWGARMEYKRRYTNPDDAKRARAPLPERRKRDRRS
jgi:hypothetical protein